MRLFFLSVLLLLMIPASAQQLSEAEKINKLITYIETLDNAVFIRNGSEYTSAHAAKFLREKHKRNTNKVKSAKDFIVVCASISSTSGKPYQVKLSDGTIVTTQELLAKELVRIEKAVSRK